MSSDEQKTSPVPDPECDHCRGRRCPACGRRLPQRYGPVNPPWQPAPWRVPVPCIGDPPPHQRSYIGDPWPMSGGTVTCFRGLI